MGRGSIPAISVICNSGRTHFKLCQYQELWWQADQNPSAPSYTHPRSNDNKYYMTINNHLWLLTGNYLFLSSEQYYNISITIWFFTWENCGFGTEDIIILRRVGMTGIQFNSKIHYLKHNRMLAFQFLPLAQNQILEGVQNISKWKCTVPKIRVNLCTRSWTPTPLV